MSVFCPQCGERQSFERVPIGVVANCRRCGRQLGATEPRGNPESRVGTYVVVGVLLVLGVPAVLGVLAAVAIPNFIKFQERARAKQPVQVLKDKDGRCQLKVPASWKPRTDLNSEALIQAGNPSSEEYVILLGERREDLSDKVDLAAYGKLAIDHFVASMTESPGSGPPKPLSVNGRPSVQYEFHGTSGNVKVAGLMTVIETPATFYRVLSWTLTSHFAELRPKLEAAAASFKADDPAPASAKRDSPDEDRLQNWLIVSPNGKVTVEQAAQGAEGAESCVVTAKRGSSALWTADSCLGTTLDFRFVGNDGQRLVVLHKLPVADHGDRAAEVAHVYGEGKLEYAVHAAGAVRNWKLLRHSGTSLLWLEGVMGVEGKAPAYSAAGDAVEFTTIDGAAQKIPLAR